MPPYSTIPSTGQLELRYPPCWSPTTSLQSSLHECFWPQQKFAIPKLGGVLCYTWKWKCDRAWRCPISGDFSRASCPKRGHEKAQTLFSKQMRAMKAKFPFWRAAVRGEVFGEVCREFFFSRSYRALFGWGIQSKKTSAKASAQNSHDSAQQNWRNFMEKGSAGGPSPGKTSQVTKSLLTIAW